LLRQVYIYLKQELLYQHFFAKGLDDAQINLLFTDILKGYLLSPQEGKAFSKPQFDWQIHYGVFKGVFFLYVTDMADRPQAIQKEVERAGKLFGKNFPDPMSIKTESVEREEFQNFIQDTHYYLHPKIALIGGKGGGKSTIVKLLAQTEEPEKKIMNFAVYYRITIKDLDFDLWDYIDADDYSMVWNNYIRGTDMLYFVINGADINDKREINFYNLYKRESKYSKMAIILTHADEAGFMGEYEFHEKFPNLSKFPLLEVNLNDPVAKNQIVDFFIDTIGLKKALPPEFREMVVGANQLVEQEQFKEAIEKLQDLLILCRKYQEFGYVELFEGKIKELEEKLKAKKFREEQEKIKISKPKEIQFSKFGGPKTLPLPGSGPAALPQVNALPKVETKLPTPTSPQISTPALTNIKPQVKEPATKEISTSSTETTLAGASGEMDIAQMQADIIGSVKAKNPFFGGLKQLTPSTTPSPKLPPLEELEEKIPESTQPSTSVSSSEKEETPRIPTPPTPILPPGPKIPPMKEDFTIRVHESAQKVKPINIDELEGKTKIQRPSYAEQILQRSLGMMDDASGEKSLGLQRSPLIKNEVVAPKSDIVKSKPLQVPQINIDLSKAFGRQKSKEEMDLVQDADRLGEAIRNLGESLSRPMCEKFIEQIRLRLKKTNLTDADIENTAKLYVEQRRKQKTE
jgi:energy-coupling factor transporter ATP-binding protein EcfA2